MKKAEEAARGEILAGEGAEGVVSRGEMALRFISSKYRLERGGIESRLRLLLLPLPPLLPPNRTAELSAASIGSPSLFRPSWLMLLLLLLMPWTPAMLKTVATSTHTGSWWWWWTILEGET